MENLIINLFGKSEKQQLREAVISYSERLCEAQKILDKEVHFLRKSLHESIKTIGIFDPQKMMDFYAQNEEIMKRDIPRIW